MKRAAPNAATLSRRGFTLIEMMITVVLIAIITGIVYASLASVADSTDIGRTAAEQMRLRQFLTRHIEWNLSQCYADWQPGASLRDPNANVIPQEIDATTDSPVTEAGEELVANYWLEGIDDSGPDGPADRISFATTAPISGGSALPGIIKQVTYEILDRSESEDTLQYLEDDSRQLVLQCREVPIFDLASLDGESADSASTREDFLDEQDFETAGWSVPISTMDIQYFDGEEWIDDWDSAVEGRLPWAILFNINFAIAPGEETGGFDPVDDPDFRLVVSLPEGAGLTEPPVEPVHRLDDQFGGRPRVPRQPTPNEGRGENAGEDQDNGTNR